MKKILIKTRFLSGPLTIDTEFEVNMIFKTKQGILVRILKDYEELSRLAAEHILKWVEANPSLSLLVPSGTTPERVYSLLSQQCEKLQKVTLYNMDEYCIKNENGIYSFLPPEDKRSYHYYMQKHLLNALPNVRSFFPEIENIEQPGRYDQLIKKQGGLDFCLNAMGEDGHTFGFNLPGSSFSSLTRLMAINHETKEVNEKLTGFTTPQYAITTGLQTGMLAKEVLILVSGKRKSGILKKVLNENISENIPATLLRTHPNCTWLVDEDAASYL